MSIGDFNRRKYFSDFHVSSDEVDVNGVTAPELPTTTSNNPEVSVDWKWEESWHEADWVNTEDVKITFTDGTDEPEWPPVNYVYPANMGTSTTNPYKTLKTVHRGNSPAYIPYIPMQVTPLPTIRMKGAHPEKAPEVLKSLKH